ncbi:MAG: putative quinol monooxygenase [Desulfomonilia bacterium]
MIVMLTILEAKPGKEHDIEHALKALIPKMDAEEGLETFILHKAQGDPRMFMSYERYKDRWAMEYHRSTAYFREAWNKITPLIQGTPRIELFEEIGSKTCAR